MTDELWFQTDPVEPDTDPVEPDDVGWHVSLDFVMDGEMADVLSACQKSARDMELQVVSLGADHISLTKLATFTLAGWKLEATLLASDDGTVTISAGWRQNGWIPVVTQGVKDRGEGFMGQFANGVSVELQEVARHRASQEPQAGAQFSVADELGKLADLRDRGALSDEEFEAQKLKLLAG
jgi:hypothetical protein|tara:strand:- start:87 stop:629 length:543 start_codon:yes stop_codon:yes gene_type:complete